MTRRYICLCLSLCCLLLACQKADPHQTALETAALPADFLPVSTAAERILNNDDGFFDRIKKLDMGIQLQKRVAAETAASLLPDYRQALQNSCKEFTEAEKQKLIAAWQKASTYAVNVLPEFDFPQVAFAKIDGSLYGDRVYFTRGQTIFLPEHELRTAKESDLVKILLHELFHVMSRTQPALQQKLYANIGFSLITAPDTLILPHHLGERELLNPDGIPKTIYTSRTGAQALPLIFSGPADYKPDRNGYFDHLSQGYYPLRREAILITTAVNDRGLTGPSTPILNDLRERIAYTTEYLLHPDEILADNFADLLIWKNKVVGDPPPDQQAYFNQLLTLLQ